jgi:hypothetical protein
MIRLETLNYVKIYFISSCLEQAELEDRERMFTKH